MIQAFLDECEQACRGVHDKEFEPTEASEISRPSVSDGSHKRLPILRVQRVSESESNTFYFVTPLSEVVLSPYLVWRFYGTICISHIPRCYGN